MTSNSICSIVTKWCASCQGICSAFECSVSGAELKLALRIRVIGFKLFFMSCESRDPWRRWDFRRKRLFQLLVSPASPVSLCNRVTVTASLFTFSPFLLLFFLTHTSSFDPFAVSFLSFPLSCPNPRILGVLSFHVVACAGARTHREIVEKKRVQRERGWGWGKGERKREQDRRAEKRDTRGTLTERKEEEEQEIRGWKKEDERTGAAAKKKRERG